MGSFRAARTPLRGGPDRLAGPRTSRRWRLDGYPLGEAASTRERIQVPVSSLSEKRYTILFLGTAIGG